MSDSGLVTHRREVMGLAEERPGVSANDLTDTRLCDGLSGNAAVNGVPVRVEPATAS